MGQVVIQKNFHPTLIEAQRAIRLEANALNLLADFIDNEFITTIDLLSNIKGRIIVTGMGKSGHIARKIAATLTSTGTAAYFLHPAEASHGDMGMITNEDAVLALSYSGETAELSNIVSYTRRFQVPLITITGKSESSLSKTADLVILLPKVEEACPHGLAPTTSTTMMLTLGDAIAICLMTKKNFSSDHFRIFHPGGSLGKKLLKVSDLMHRGDAIPLIQEKSSMRDAILVMTQKRLGCIGVVSKSKQLAGIITDGDLRRHIDEDILSKNVESVMTPNPKTIRSGALAQDALALMNNLKITSLFVIDRDIEGIVHIHDCYKAGIA